MMKLTCKSASFSVIVPIYNAASTLDRCIDSVLGQTVSPKEVILVDDGSTDDSLTKCQALKDADSRIRVCSKPNGGVSSARNVGISIASADYVCFVDSDDAVKPDMLELFLAEIEENPEVDLLIAGFEGSDGTMSVPPADVRCLNELEKYFADFFNSFLLHSPVSKCYKKARISVPFDESVSLGEDLLFNLSFLKSDLAIKCIPKTPYQYYVHDGNSLSKRGDVDIVHKLQKLYSRAEELLSSLLMQDQFMNILAMSFERDLVNHCRRNAKALSFKEFSSVFMPASYCIKRLRGEHKDIYISAGHLPDIILIQRGMISSYFVYARLRGVIARLAKCVKSIGNMEKSEMNE